LGFGLSEEPGPEAAKAQSLKPKAHDVIDELVHLPDTTQVARVVVRLFVAGILGALLGAERESVGKAAGLRTHMLVALGAALFVLIPVEFGFQEGDLGRVIQGVATGIGFLGAGTILKRREESEITGLTTAAAIWLTAAVGLAAGVGRVWLAIVGALSAWVILYGVRRIEAYRSGAGPDRK
jgi:putative Mg2+ transporter-C (MgtC) family protein